MPEQNRKLYWKDALRALEQEQARRQRNRFDLDRLALVQQLEREVAGHQAAGWAEPQPGYWGQVRTQINIQFAPRESPARSAGVAWLIAGGLLGTLATLRLLALRRLPPS